METLAHERILSELDHLRLSRLLHRDRAANGAAPWARDLEAVLDSAIVCPSRHIGADVVTMHSQVLLSQARAGGRCRLTLCYPDDSDPAAGFVSVLSPVGASLLGLRVGATAQWRTPAGNAGAAEVLAILFQPEASGDYTTWRSMP